MKIDEIRALLEKYQLGTCTQEEQRIIDEWYDFLQLDEEQPLGEAELDSSLAKIHMNLQELPAGRPGLTPVTGAAWAGPDERISGAGRTIGRRLGTQRTMAAAAVLVLLSAGIWLYFSSREQGPVKFAGLRGQDNDTMVSTGRGETRQIVLPDGSTMQLNAATELKYPKRFSGGARAIELVRGEIFCQVAPNPGLPFTVTTGHTQTTVLGTSFNIRAYEQENSTEIALLTGKIKVSAGEGRPSSTLEPHQIIRIDGGTDEMASGYFDNDYDVAAWKDGGLYFKDASFGKVAFEIGNKYNIDVINKSDKQQWSYTGLFRNGSLQEVIETICQTENLGYEFTGNGILITNKN